MPSPARAPGALRFALWLSLSMWTGSWAFFAFVVSRVAFEALPGPVAGDLAGSLITTLHYGGVVAAIVVAAASAGLGRPRWLVVAPLALGAVCLVSELVLTPEIAAVRPSAVGETATEASASRFRTLHQLSLGLFLAVHLASLALIALHARLDAPAPGADSGARD